MLNRWGRDAWRAGFIAAWAAAGGAQAASFDAPPVVRFVQDADLGPPLLSVERDAQGLRLRGGLSIDLNRAIAAEMGLTARFLPQPHSRVETALQNDTADLLCPADPARLRAPQRLRWIEGVYLNDRRVLIGADGTSMPAQVSQLADLPADAKTVRIAIAAGQAAPELQPLLARRGLRRDEVASEDAALRSLLAGRAAYAVVTGVFLDDWLRREPTLRAQLGPMLTLATVTIRCAIGPKSRITAEAVDEALKRLRASGGHEAMLKRYR